MAPIRVGLLGTGGIMGKHARSLAANPSVQITALCDVSKKVCQQFIDHMGHSNVADLSSLPIFTESGKMYERSQLDAVVIATPHTMHFEHSMQALDAGCHVLVEKPMVTQADHAYQIKDRVDQTGKVLVIGYNTPCCPEFFYLRHLIRDKTLSSLRLVNGYLSQSWHRGTTGSWRQDPGLSGGGMAYDSGAHILNSVCWSVEANVMEVHAFIDNLDCEVDINSAINIRFENGVFASIAIGGDCPIDGSHLTFMFNGGRVDIDGWSGNWINVYKDRQRVKYPPITGEPMHPADNFIDAILGRDEPRTCPANGIVHSELMDAIYESARTGQPARPRRSGV